MRRRSALQARASILQAIRLFFINQGYLEVETPHRIPAPAPESHIDAVPSGSWFLHTSPELCMKRLLAAGYEKIFQICRCWRGEERGCLHTPEFTLLEWYRTESDYRALMEECEAFIQAVASTLGLGDKLHFRGQTIDLTRPWERISVEDAFQRYAPVPMRRALAEHVFDEVMVEKIEPRLGMNRPTFLYDYPAERGALARLKGDDPTLAERFEFYIGGLELANAFSELIDTKEQRERFLAEQAYRRSLSKPPYPLPEKFLRELGTMPPAAGIALGVDRLVMVLLDTPTIDEVVAFTPEEL
jgi:elongation factor P--(R)-beta-lysine ligase